MAYALERHGADVYAVAVASLGANIRRLRERPGARMSKADLARAMGVVYQRVQDWENDRYKKVELSTLLKLARGLRVTVEDLISNLDDDYDQMARDLIRQTPTVESGLPQHVGGPIDETTAARLQRLEQENAALRFAVNQTEDVARRLGQIAGDLSEARAVALTAAGRSGTDRKTG